MWRSPSGAWKTRVYAEDGVRSVVLGLGVEEGIAGDMERMALSFRAQRKWAWVELLMSRRAKIGKAYDKWLTGKAEEFFTEIVQVQADADLDPIVQEWADEGADAKYVRQVRRMIPAGERFPLSKFRRRFIGQWLKTVKPEARVKKLSTETRSRYRAALSAFGEFLIEREYLEGNPVHRIRLSARSSEKRSENGSKGREARHLPPEQVRQLVEALCVRDAMLGALEALMACTGMEKQAVLRTRVEDVDLERKMVFARGSKHDEGYRTRWVEATEEWAWLIVVAHVQYVACFSKRSDLVWPAAEKWERAWTDTHNAVAAEQTLPFTTPHNHRHSFAVMWIKRGATGGLRTDGRDTQWLKNQLGHGPHSNQLFVTYGVYIGQANLTAKVTPKVTSA